MIDEKKASDELSQITQSSVAIILCTYNGEEYIEQQLESIIAQTILNWTIFASDDGSTDATLSILEKYQKILGSNKLVILKGPKKGFAWNFLSALKYTPESFQYYAFCDQDDIWLSNKLETGVRCLRQYNANVPGIHCGRTALVDENGQRYGMSYLFERKPSFKNALMQNIAGGNTMLLNHAAKKIIAETPDDCDIISHDWWVYIVIAGCGDNIIYDPVPTLLYRQHASNVIGSNISFFSKLYRIRRFFSGDFRIWSDKNLRALQHFETKLTEENRSILTRFSKARNDKLIPRIITFADIGFYRQTLSGDIALMLGIIFKKI